MKNEKKKQALQDILNKMFEVSGHDITYNDIMDREDDWFQQYTMTEDQNKQWKSWSVDYLRKNLRLTKVMAEKEMDWLDMQFGLKTIWEQTITESLPKQK